MQGIQPGTLWAGGPSLTQLGPSLVVLLLLIVLLVILCLAIRKAQRIDQAPPRSESMPSTGPSPGDDFGF